MTDNTPNDRHPKARDRRVRITTLVLTTVALLAVVVCGYGQLGFCAEHRHDRQRHEQAGRPTREEFRAKAVGMSPEEVVKEFGPPAATADYGDYRIWTYFDLVYDPPTDRVVRVSTVEFRGGKVTEAR